MAEQVKWLKEVIEVAKKEQAKLHSPHLLRQRYYSLQKAATHCLMEETKLRLAKKNDDARR